MDKMDHRSPLDNIFNIIGGLPQGHDKPIKHALYNSLALFLLFICCAALGFLYLILEPFIKPLMWALLVGSVLHPIKYTLAQKFKSWFDTLDESRTPIVIGIFFIPINIINDISEFIGCTLVKHWKLLLAIGISAVSLHLLYFYTPTVFVSIFYNGWILTEIIISFFISNLSTTLVILILLAYISVLVSMWKPENNKKFHYASMMVWLVLSLFIAKQFGAFQIPIFILLQGILLGGLVFEIMDIQEQLRLSESDSSIFSAIKFAIHGKEKEYIKLELQDKGNGEENTETMQEEVNKEENILDEPEIRKDPWSLDLFDEASKSRLKNTNVLIVDKGRVQMIKKPAVFESPAKVRRSFSQPSVPGLNLKNKVGLLSWRKRSSRTFKVQNGEYASDFYICSLLWGCAIVFFWKNLMLVPILCIPIAIYFIKRCGAYLGIWSMLYTHGANFLCKVTNWCHERNDAIIPVPIRGLYRIVYKANQFIKKNVKESIDTVSSCVVILGLLVFVLCASIFICVQVYAEAITVVQISSNVINQTVVHNPELRQLLPPAFENTVDSLLDNAYQYGREGISKGVKSMMSGVDPSKSEKLEQQVLELWDRIYQAWMNSDSDQSHGPKVTSDAVQKTWNNFIDDLQKSPEMFNISGLMSFVNQNVGTLISLLDSIWSIVKGNISLVLGSFSAIVSVLLGGGTAVLNFILNVIIFLTTLFYLLSSSGELYKPVELMTQFSSNGNRLGLALGDAINGVFTASFKMATFYGLWTWFIHNLFNVKIVYLPSAVAAILGAAPFLGTYWACIPAVFDLWLAQEKGLQAILFAAVQFVPMSIVDATIYAEMKGGHPYLTGLAIAGGIFCLGLEGAIIGPLILCGLYVAMDLSTTLFKDSPSEETINLQDLSR